MNRIKFIGIREKTAILTVWWSLVSAGCIQPDVIKLQLSDQNSKPKNGTEGGGPGNNSSGGSGSNLHPLYPSLDLAALPNGGGGELGPFQVSELPRISRSVTLSSRFDIERECARSGGGLEINVPAGTVLDQLTLSGQTDCRFVFGDGSVVRGALRMDNNNFTQNPGIPSRIEVINLRVEGMILIGGRQEGNGATDIVLRRIVGASFDMNQINRLTILDSTFITGGGGPIINGDNVAVLNTNIFTSDPNHHNSWAFRTTVGNNIIIKDSTFASGRHKVIRMAQTNYFFVENVVMMREQFGLNDFFATVGAASLPFIDQNYTYFRNCEMITIHDGGAALIGPHPALDTIERFWQMENIHFIAKTEDTISSDMISHVQNLCQPEENCDLRPQSHRFTYTRNERMTLPNDRWRRTAAGADLIPRFAQSQ